MLPRVLGLFALLNRMAAIVGSLVRLARVAER